MDLRQLSAECENGDGWFVIVLVEGQGNGWQTTVNDQLIEGSYASSSTFGPFFEEIVVITFTDIGNPDCVVSIDLVAPDGCVTTDPCFGFATFVEIPTICDTIGTNWVGIVGGVFPVVVDLFREGDNEVFRSDTMENEGDLIYEELPRGNYTVQSKDARDCTSSVTFTVGACSSISGRSWVDQNGNGIRESGDGPLRIEVQLYQDDNTLMRSTSTSDDGLYAFEGIAEGNYFVQFNFDNSLEATLYRQGDDPTVDSDVLANSDVTDIISVTEGVAVTNIDAGWLVSDCIVFLEGINAGCLDNDGSLAAIANGTPPFIYAWSNGATTQTVTGLATGEYAVTVTDANGCVATGQGVVLASTLQVFVQQSGGECSLTGQQANLRAVVIGGAPPYVYEWILTGEVVSTSASVNEVVIEEVYELVVTDAAGCRIATQAAFESQVETINFFAPFFLPCEGGTVTLSAGDQTDFLEYYWLAPNGDTLRGPEVEASDPGLYEVTGISPNGGCIRQGVAFVITENLNSLDVSIAFYGDTICGESRCIYLEEEFGFELLQGVEVVWTLPTGDIIETNPWTSICDYGPGIYSATLYGSCDTLALTYLLEGDVECSALNGTVYADQDGNCGLDDGDTPAPGVVVVASNVANGEQYYAITDIDGKYGFYIPEGSYTVRPVLDPNLPFGSCEPPASGTVTTGAVETVDVFLPALLDCPLMTTSVSIPFLRRCFDNIAFVEYANLGSSSAENAMLTVTLDDFLINVVPSIPAASQNGNTFIFDLGTVAPFESGRILFTFIVNCDAQLGQTHCIESEVSPSEPCKSPESWNGALVNVSGGQCNGELVTFAIQNVGDNPMSVPLSYVVVEDGIMMSGIATEVESLPAGGIFEVNLPADGHTYHVITNQEPNAPASPTPTAVAEGCNSNPNGVSSTGFANIINLGNEVPSQAIACRRNVGAYDPNDKMGFPLGYDGGNIPEGTRLDYAVRFQNTGTDTAFTVVIQDTISAALDLGTFKVTSASHPYTVTMDTNRVVTFRFENIELPDSNVNLAASQGVINFSIDHVADLLPGDKIENEALIYFDFNEPIVTNLSLHRIAKDGLPVSTRQERARQVAIGISPNPGPGVIRVDIPRAEVELTDVLSVTDLYGRQLASTTYGQLGGDWNVSHLPAGYYLLVVSNASGQAKGRTGFVIAK